jgi:hypothetical protein
MHVGTRFAGFALAVLARFARVVTRLGFALLTVLANMGRCFAVSTWLGTPRWPR